MNYSACNTRLMTNFQNQLKTAETHLAKNDPIIGSLINKYGKCQLKPHENYYQELASGIIGQQLSVKVADVIWRRFLNIFNGLMPSPAQIIETDKEVLCTCGISYRKCSYLKDLAQKIDNKDIEIEKLITKPNDEIITDLCKVKGIGPWSVHMFLIFSLGRLNVLPYSDYGIRKSIMLLYKFESMPDKKLIEEIAKNKSWTSYESVAAWYLWKNLGNKS